MLTSQINFYEGNIEAESENWQVNELFKVKHFKHLPDSYVLTTSVISLFQYKITLKIHFKEKKFIAKTLDSYEYELKL